ncbi:hypothetical protein MRB53_006306 [Persea americana]|uniref:Uncharacterized protein n=1 Tax=Persea americana TaxID=3435 RepID=A0ACC2MG25_PERAE|nr:hypothetical protein MRB53_006306 [Persea americana]
MHVIGTWFIFSHVIDSVVQRMMLHDDKMRRVDSIDHMMIRLMMTRRQGEMWFFRYHAMKSAFAEETWWLRIYLMEVGDANIDPEHPDSNL